MSVSDYLKGPVGVSGAIVGHRGQLTGADMTLDLTPSTLSLDLVGINKPAGFPASAHAVVTAPRSVGVRNENRKRDPQHERVLPGVVQRRTRIEVLREHEHDRDRRDAQRGDARRHDRGGGDAPSARATADRICSIVIWPSTPCTTCPLRSTITLVGKPIAA